MTPCKDSFYEYYARESATPSTLARFAATKAAVLRAAGRFGLAPPPYVVADIGCGAGTQCMLWAQDGHQVSGLDINDRLIQLGLQRGADAGLDLSLTVGSATTLPWPDASFDICLCPELLEHVEDWQSVVAEAVRVLRPGGLLYLSTTNRLCPIQQEFDLPLYSWYPRALKKRYEYLAVTSRPELANHAKFPAVNWFTFYGLREHLAALGLVSLDRFDVADCGTASTLARIVLGLLQRNKAAKALGQVLTPYTAVFAHRPEIA